MEQGGAGMNRAICKKCEKNCNCIIFARTVDGRKYAHVMQHKAVKDMKDTKEAWQDGVLFGIFLGMSDFIVSQNQGIVRRHVGYARYNGLPPHGRLDELKWDTVTDEDWLLNGYPPDRDSQDTCAYYTEQMIGSLSGDAE
jgi:hypothetical protein